MPTIEVPFGGTKGNVATYPNTVGTAGVGISYTITTASPTYNYWVITNVLNCTVSSYYGSDGQTITVTPTVDVTGILQWAFRVVEWQNTVSPTSSEPEPETSLDGEITTLRIGGNYPTFNGYAIASGPLLPSVVADPTFGLALFNSSGNKTLDLGSIYPQIYASGNTATLAPGTIVNISLPGFIPNGKFFPIAFASTPNLSYFVFTYYVWVISGDGQSYTYKNNEFTINYSSSAPSSASLGWVVIKL